MDIHVSKLGLQAGDLFIDQSYCLDVVALDLYALALVIQID
jgi:hypothetical protein